MKRIVLIVPSFLIGSILWLPASYADESVPYTDSNSVGTIGLCDKAGNTITSGNVHDRPFAFTVVSSAAAPAPYDVKGRKATLFAFQPRKDVVPGRWSGDSLTASSEYSNAKHPMAAGTLRDFSLTDYLESFPVRWDGLVQLRMYLSAPNTSILKLPYPTTDIRVSGDTWTVVRGGTGDCSVGKATSNEVAVFGTAPPTPTASVNAGGGKTSTAPPASLGVGGSSSSSPNGISADGVTPRVTDAADGNQHQLILFGGVAVVLLAFGSFAFSWWRNRPLGEE